MTPAQQQAIAKAKARLRLQNEPRKAEAFTRGATGRFAQNLLEIPKLIESGANAMTIPGFVSLLTGADQKKMSDLFPGTTSSLTDHLPSVDQIFAGAQKLGEVGGAIRTGDFNQFTPFDQATQQQRETTEQLQAQHPVASVAGDITGDIMTLTGLSPLRSGARKLEEGVRAGRSVANTELDHIVNSQIVKNLKITGIRSGEAGLEGAVLSVLNEQDPLKTAAFAAGSQATGSALLGLNSALLSGSWPAKITKVGGTALGLGFLIQMGKEKIPGGRDRVLESFETSGAIMATVGLLGGLAKIAGLDRSGQTFTKNLPGIVESYNTISRNAWISAMKDIFAEQDSGDNTIERVTNQMLNDPGSFSAETMERIDDAFRNGKLKEEIDSLMQDENFRKQLNQNSLPQNPSRL